jgi:hypothetical protein
LGPPNLQYNPCQKKAHHCTTYFYYQERGPHFVFCTWASTSSGWHCRIKGYRSIRVDTPTDRSPSFIHHRIELQQSCASLRHHRGSRPIFPLIQCRLGSTRTPLPPHSLAAPILAGSGCKHTYGKMRQTLHCRSNVDILSLGPCPHENGS